MADQEVFINLKYAKKKRKKKGGGGGGGERNG